MAWIRPHFVAALTLIIVTGCDRGGPVEGPDGAAPIPAGGAAHVTESSEDTVATSPATDTCTGAATTTDVFAGFWRTDSGSARFGGRTTAAGETDMTLRSSNGGLTLTVEGFPTVRLQRLSLGAAPWTWPTGSDVAVTPDEAVITVGCNDQDGFARFTGATRVQAEGGGSAMTTFRLMMYTPDDGLLHWEMGPPMQSSGLFAVSRAR
jgi:predicted small lipoprotein YifL